MEERNVLFNNTLDTFYLRSSGVRHGKELLNRENPWLPFRRLLFRISKKGSLISTIPQTGKYIPWPVLWSSGWNKNQHNRSTMRNRSDNPSHQKLMLYHRELDLSFTYLLLLLALIFQNDFLFVFLISSHMNGMK